MGNLDAIETILMLCFFALPVWGVVDAVRIPDQAWEKAGRSKRFWVVIQMVLLYIGAVMYLTGVRKDVMFFAASASPDWEEDD